jgi:thiosulfate reductase cytochrome b subunit
MKKIYLHPLPVRIWHWINAVSFLILIITGLQLRYREVLNMMTFKTAVEIHNMVGFVLLFNFFIWLGFYLLSKKIGIYIPELSMKKFVENSFRQARYYAYGIFMGESNPHHGTPDNQFNPLQQMAYLNIMMLLIPAQIATGILMWDVKGFAVPISLLGGLKIVDSVHVLLFLFFSSFLFIHIYLATLGHTPMEHIKAMFTGYEEVE